MTRRQFAILAVIGVGVAGLGLTLGPTFASPRETIGEKLFFALEVRDGNKLIARPKLIGVEGKPVNLYLTYPDADHTPKLDLQLDPARNPAGYLVGVTLSIPGKIEAAKDEVILGNGEERELAWAGSEGPVRLKLMLMRVSSPEFKAYLDFGSRTPGDGRT